MLPNYDPLIGFKLSQGEFITYQIGNSSSKRLWLAIRYCFPKGVEISEGDVVKLGRIRMKIRKIMLSNTTEERESMPKCFDSLASQVEVNEEIDQEASCRICFSNEITENNPLISPCECMGSIKYIHVECIKNWLRSRIQTKTTGYAVSYYWNDLVCELCKTSLPASVYYQGTKMDLVSIEYPTKPYILFEEFTPENINSNGIHVVTVDEGKSISVGRSQDADFRISDISVSRKHAAIHFSEGKFTVSDNKSKFGTLIKMKKVISLSKDKSVSIQVGRTMFHICVKKKINCKKFCCNPFRKVAPECTYITQEGFDHSLFDPRLGMDSHSVHQSVRSVSYNEG